MIDVEGLEDLRGILLGIPLVSPKKLKELKTIFNEYFSIKDRVAFLCPPQQGFPRSEGTFHGTIIKINRKSINVEVDGDDDGIYRRISPLILFPLIYKCPDCEYEMTESQLGLTSAIRKRTGIK